MIETWEQAEQAFCDMLDECGTQVVTILGIQFAPSRILRECDPIAYKVYCFDYLDAQGINTDELDDSPSW